MTGSLQTKNSKLYVVINYKEGGKYKQRWIPTGLPSNGSRKEAERILRKELLIAEQSQNVITTDILFADYIRYWLTVVKANVELVTYQGYELIATRNVIPYFQRRKTKLKNVTKQILQEYFDYIAIYGRENGSEPLSPSTLKHFKNIVNQSLNLAVKEDLLFINPCQYVQLPKRQQYDSQYYNVAQLKDLFRAIEGDVLEPLIKFTTLYGLRRSEVLGIKWDSIDFKYRRLTIKHTVVYFNSRVEKDTTKNKSSRRSFALTDEAIEILLKVMEQDEQNKQAFGEKYIENDYVFKWPNGKPFSPRYVSSHFQVLLKRNDLPHIRFHELRHSTVSLLLNNGYTLKDVQEYVGHADIRMTTDLYGHLDVARKNALSAGISSSLFQ